MAKKKKLEEEKLESAGMMRWLLTYADMITLLLAFFIIMYASSTISVTKYQSLAAAMAAAFGLKGSPAVMTGGAEEGAKPIIFPASQLQVTQIKNKLQKYVLEQKLQTAINIHLNERGLLIRIYADKVRFAPGSAALSPEYKRILNAVAGILASTPNAVQVNGYTDDTAAPAGGNWALSSMRAVNTVKYLVSRNIDPERLSAVGYGQYHPLVPNTDEIHRSMNRRIDIQVFKAPFFDEMMNGGEVQNPSVSPAPAVPATPVTPPDLSPVNGVNPKPLTF